MKYLFIGIILLLARPVLSQSSVDLTDKEKKESTERAVSPVSADMKAFRGIDLGMDMATVKKLLLSDPLFNYRGEPDVMFNPGRTETIIECSGNSYVKHAYFQFHENRVFIITIVLSDNSLDYFTMFGSLTKKYGQPAFLNPDVSVWKFADSELHLEKPLSVKYIATKVFDKLVESGKTEERAEQLSREKFLEEF